MRTSTLALLVLAATPAFCASSPTLFERGVVTTGHGGHHHRRDVVTKGHGGHHHRRDFEKQHGNDYGELGAVVNGRELNDLERRRGPHGSHHHRGGHRGHKRDEEVELLARMPKHHGKVHRHHHNRRPGHKRDELFELIAKSLQELDLREVEPHHGHGGRGGRRDLESLDGLEDQFTLAICMGRSDALTQTSTNMVSTNERRVINESDATSGFFFMSGLAKVPTVELTATVAGASLMQSYGALLALAASPVFCAPIADAQSELQARWDVVPPHLLHSRDETTDGAVLERRDHKYAFKREELVDLIARSIAELDRRGGHRGSGHHPSGDGGPGGPGRRDLERRGVPTAHGAPRLHGSFLANAPGRRDLDRRGLAHLPPRKHWLSTMRTSILAILALAAIPAFCTPEAAAQSELQAREIQLTPEQIALLHAPIVARDDITDGGILERRHKHHEHHDHHDHHGHHDHKREEVEELVARRTGPSRRRRHRNSRYAFKRDELSDDTLLEKRHKHHEHHDDHRGHHDHHGHRDHKREDFEELVARRAGPRRGPYVDKREELVDLIARSLEEIDRRGLPHSRRDLAALYSLQ
ncbi:hypothetical protein EIP91_011958 [Steccherinum ochraceum]|uniref:Uncharacterized protein n=1 Tax=Steccherinum ochraceum TaxID=92696 RepID=A0A4R0RKV6_9APHY|nr:hypothetical protein EIP91_011958 [Steccherinum ochraceum]